MTTRFSELREGASRAVRTKQADYFVQTSRRGPHRDRESGELQPAGVSRRDVLADRVAVAVGDGAEQIHRGMRPLDGA